MKKIVNSNFFKMNSSRRRVSKRHQTGGNTSTSKRGRVTGSLDSFFTRSLEKSGIVFSNNGGLQNTMTVDVQEFQRIFQETLLNHQPIIDEAVREFITGFEEYINDYSRFHKALLDTVTSGDVSRGLMTLPSIVRLLLCASEVQMGVAKVVTEKLLDFTTDEPVGIVDLDVREVREIPKLILSQLRWLDYLVNGKELCDKLLEVAVVLPVYLQRDIIQSLPHIIEDDQHSYVANKLKDICQDNSDLLTACIDTWSELNMDLELATEVLELVMDTLPSADIEDLPIVLNYILTQKMNLRNVVEVVREVRDKLDTDSCFVPLPIMTSTPHPNMKSQSTCSSSGYVVLDCIQGSLERLKVVSNAWIKVIESVDEEEDHKLLDLFVLFVLYGVPGNCKSIRNVIVNKVKAKKFTESILAQFFQHQIPNLKHLFSSVLSIAEHLLCSTMPAVSMFAQKLYQHAFAASDIFKQQDIIGTLVAMTTSGSSNETDSALEVLEDLVNAHPKEVERFSVLIKNVLDYLEPLSVAQIRKVYSILSMLAYSINEDSDAGLHDELESMIRKQLHHSDEKYRHIGVIAAVMAVKQITQPRNQCDNTFDILSGSSKALSSKRKQQAEDLLKQVFSVVAKDHTTASLFFDEMGNVVLTSKMHSDILDVIRVEVTDLFQECYVVESSEKLTSECGVSMCYAHSLDVEDDGGEEGIAIDLMPCVLKSINAEKLQDRSITHRVEALCSNFRLLRILEQAFNEGLSEVDALLGCAVILPSSDLLKDSVFVDLELEQKQIICAALFHCINWFRELLSAFGNEADLEMRGKVLKRLNAITELQHTLNVCLRHTPGPIPSVLNISVTTEGLKMKQIKKKSNRKSKPDTTLAAAVTTATSTQLEQGGQDNSGTQEKSLHVTTQSDSLLRLRGHFRELDQSVFSVLGYEPLSRSMLEDNSIEEIKLEFPHLLFLLQELYHRVSSQFNIFVAKKKTRDKESTQAGSKDKELALLLSKTIIPALCNQLETINSYLQTHADDNDGVLDRSVDSTNYQLILDCFQLIFKTLTAFFNWPLLSDPLYERILKDSLRAFSGRISQASTQEDANINFLTRKTFRYLERFSDLVPSLVPAAAQCRVLVSIQKITKVKEVKRHIAEYCGKLLKRSWTDLNHSSHSATNEALEYIIKYYIGWSDDPLEIIEDIYGNAIPEMMGEESKDQSTIYPTLSIQTLTCYYRALSVAVVTCVKGIPSVHKDNPPSSEVLLEAFQTLQLSTEHYLVLVNLVKSFDLKGIISSALKNGRSFIEAFMRNGIPIVDLLFKLRKDDVLTTLKTLQQATRCLHHFCGHSKVLKDISLTNHVPNLKRSLELLIFRVKEVVINHNCAEAFWMGSLKNRDIQGQIIPSQTSQQSMSFEDTEAEAECQSTSNDDGASHVSNPDSESCLLSDED